MNASMSSKRLLAVAIGAMLAAAGGVAAAQTQQAPDAGATQSAAAAQTGSSSSAQQSTQRRRGGARQARTDRNTRGNQDARAEVEQDYPEATRQNPETNASASASRKMSKMMDLYEADEGAQASAIADEILADSGTNPYEKSYSAQVAGQIAYDADDVGAAIGYYQQVIEFDGLDNNAHYNVMLNLAQLQQQQDQYPKSQATFERFFKETGSQDPTALMMQGQGLYLMERYEEAAAIMERAIAASADPSPQWQALLMQVYAEGGNSAEAVGMAEKVAAAKPDDKRAQMNLAATYQNAGMPDKAIAILEQLRASGQLSTGNEYQVLYATYANMDGREKDVIAVINEGMQKGALEPDHQAYVALAQAYYFSDQPDLAIDTYNKAAPLDSDGSTYLNLAKVLHQESRISEAKDAARKALEKGVEKQDDANRIIALPGS
ncbi:tetratricopeptide repeat protein [Lysobacter sp. A289]